VKFILPRGNELFDNQANVVYKWYVPDHTSYRCFNMDITHQSPQPLYQQLKRQILHQITSGAYRPDEPIDSERQLSHQFQISRHTVRQAINELVLQGFLYRQPGKGTFVRPQRTTIPRIEITSISSQVYDWTRQSTVWLDSPRLVEAPDFVIDQLDLDQSANVIFLTHIQRYKGDPVNYWKSWIPEDVGIGLLTRPHEESSILDLLLNCCGVLGRASQDRIIPAIATAEEADVLDIHVGDPVQIVTGRFLSSEFKPIEAHRATIRSERFHMDIESELRPLYDI
jgi:GntR family transcriptional regulator